MPPDVQLGRRRSSTPARSLIAALAAVAFTAGCGAGFGAQTQQIYDPAAGVTVRSADVYVLNALFVTNPDSTATLSVSLLDRFGDGDQLVGVTVMADAGDPIDVTQSVHPYEICADQLAILGPSAAVTISGDNFMAGDTVELALTFADAEPVRMQVPVLPRGSDATFDSVAESADVATTSPQQPCGSATLTPSPTPSS